MKILNNTKFFTTVNDLNHLPNTTKEIAFVGRSNSGKSSVINTITNQKKLAFVSKQPGRTQHINYFELDAGVFLVDLPGYGYAQVPESIRKHWVDLLGNYLATRKELIALIMIMDIRHPLKELDKRMLDFIAYRNLPVHILLSKADKLSKQEQMKSIKSVQNLLLSWKKKTKVSIQLFSSLKKTGIDDIEKVITDWII